MSTLKENLTRPPSTKPLYTKIAPKSVLDMRRTFQLIMAQVSTEINSPNVFSNSHELIVHYALVIRKGVSGI